MLPQPGLQPSLGLTNVALDTAAWDLIHNLGPFLYWESVFDLGQHKCSDSPDLQMTLKMS